MGLNWELSFWVWRKEMIFFKKRWSEDEHGGNMTGLIVNGGCTCGECENWEGGVNWC